MASQSPDTTTTTTTTLTPAAYHTILLHLSKHPTATVLGLLLGPSSSTSNHVTHAIPLFHHWNALSPMAELALALTTTYANDNNLVLVGLYEAPRDVSARTPSIQSLRLAEKIASLSPSGGRREATLLVVNNTTLLTPQNHSLIPFLVSAPPPPPASQPSPSSNAKGSSTQPPVLPAGTPKSRSLPLSSVSFAGGQSTQNVVEATEQKIREERFKLVVDFDDHLANPSLSWLVQPDAVTA